MSRKNGMSAVKVAVVALLAAATAILSTGCNPECVDKYDCLAAAKQGATYTCENNKCIKQAATSTDAGTP